ncbi:retinol dehydrogenase 8 [Moniliophthora roreri MCA 2997]|uniref:Retinol dehydrogenase 8 n=1 Tax=Moniliophthora roreri (strain MCA 2997) TaxID=1381753 RepID=V2WY82_MONRO|nr:retinol dehydrogenase 8 [Moniliophthora roreri MCA 2997]
MSSSQLVWLITGTSTGLGRDLTLAALRRGDKVIATARAKSISQLNDLKAMGADTLELDVTAPLGKLQEVAKKAVAIHGRVDVVVNNAGYLQAGPLEETTPEETYDQFNTNVFGALNVSRAFLPYLRERKTGTIVFIGSLAGWRSIPHTGLYVASKWALRGISETLHDEIAPLGLRSVCIDPGAFRTPFLVPGHRKPYIPRIADYASMVEQREAALEALDGTQAGDPRRGVEVILDVVRGEGLVKDMPFQKSVQLGSDCYTVAKGECENALKRLEEWKKVTFSTDFPKNA